LARSSTTAIPSTAASGQTFYAYEIDWGYLTYVPNPSVNATYQDSFTFTANDGYGDSLPATVAYTVNVTPNSPPIVTGGTLALQGNQSHALTTANFGYSDPDGDPLQNITIHSTPTSGTLEYYGYPIYNGQTFYAYEIDWGYLTYVPNPIANETYQDSFTFTANDGYGDSLPASVAYTVNVTPNLPPVVTGGTFALQSNQSRTLTIADLGYSDSDGDPLQSITIHSTPTPGTLEYYGYPIYSGQTFYSDDIDWGYLTYVPNPSASASYQDSFTFTANDGFGDSLHATITYTDTPSTPRLSTSNVSVFENTGTASILVTLSHASDSPISVDYHTTNGTAIAGSDFNVISGTLNFNPGETSKTVIASILDDEIQELDEYFDMNFSNPLGAELLTTKSAVTIKNDDADGPGDRIADAQPVLLVTGTLIEINETIGDGLYGSADVDFYQVELAAGQRLSIDLDAAFADDGTVISELDGRLRVFNAAGTELTPGGPYRSGHGVSPNDFSDSTGFYYNYADDFFEFTSELPGFFYIAVSSESNGFYDPLVVNSGDAADTPGGTGAYRLQLLSSVAPVPTLHVIPRQFDESDGATEIFVELDYPSAQAISVDYAAVVGTATSPADLSLPPGTLIFPPGTKSKSIPITIVGDSLIEGNEHFQLVLSNAVGAPVYAESTEFMIVDSEPNPIQYLRLVRDTGHTRHDLRTVNPNLMGRVEGDFGSATARVEFDHNADGIVDGFVAITTTPQEFVYDPRNTDPNLDGFVGNVPMRYRFAMTEPNGSVIETSWQDFSYVLEEVLASVYVVTQLSHLTGQTDSQLPGPSLSFGMQITGHVYAYESHYGSENGYGSSSTDCEGPIGPFPEGGAPSSEPNADFENPFLGDGCGPSSGGQAVEGTEPPSLTLAIPVELDLNMDGEVDATTTTNSERDFNKFFVSFESGYHTIQARALEWNEDYGMYLIGAWVPYSFHWVSAAAPNVVELSLLNDTGDSDSDLHTHDPRIVGHVHQPFHNVTEVEVEYDLDGNGVVDGQVSIDDDASFTITPIGLSAGWQTVLIRSSAWDRDASAIIKGNWQSLSFHYSPVPLPEVQGISLLVDDGESSTDKITTNATLIGIVSPPDGGRLTLYIDLDQNGVADLIISPQHDGQFLYNALELQPGSHTVSVWATRYSDIFQEIESGPIQAFNFTLLLKPQSPLAVAELALVEDTGVNQSDFVTSNSAILGRLVNSGTVAGLTIEIDVDGDGIVDGTTTTDAMGRFRFSPVGLSPGPKSISARGVAYNYATEALEPGEWSSISFSLVATTNEPAIITDLGLLNDSGIMGDNRTKDARLTGRVLNNASAEGVAVELDINGDGIADQTIYSGKDGRFTIDPRFVEYNAKTVSLRAVTYDPQSLTTVLGSWTTFSFVYEDQPDTAPIASELQFDAGEVAGGTLPSLVGNVRYQHPNSGLLVEVDWDGDGISDLITTTDAFGQFRFQFKNLPNNTSSLQVRSVAVNPTNKSVQTEAWQQLVINYVISTPAAASVVNIGLAEDNGSSSTDSITTKPRIIGEVSRKPIGHLMIVEVDTNGDFVADGTTIVGANLQWTYTPANLAVGSVTVAARTRDTAVDGQTVFSAWTSYTFTLQSGVDSTNPTEQQDQQNTIQDASNQADSDRNVADSDLTNAITSANQDQDATVAAAEHQFNHDRTQAANALALARATSAANFQASLLAFNGNATSFDFEPIQWPDSPNLDRFVIPADGTLPQPRQENPDYQGPAYDFNSSPTYLAATNSANAVYDLAISNSTNERQHQNKLVQEAYQDAVNTERSRANAARDAAQETYRTALAQSAPTDLVAARNNYNAALQAATDQYRSEVDAANLARNTAIQEASNTASSSYQSAQNAYTSWTLAASRAYSQAIADADHAFSNAAITANTAWYKALSDAQQTRSLAENIAAKTYDDAVAAHDNELRGIKITATIAREKALATISRDTAIANADAVQNRDKQLATNAQTEQIVIAQANTTLWLAQTNAKKSAIVAWNTAISSPWTAYQVNLADNELSYFQSLSIAFSTHAQTLANAEKNRADAVADASRQQAHQAADEKHTLDHGYSDAKSIYWTDSATSFHDATLDANSERLTIRDEFADIAHALAIQSADDGEIYARTMNDARHDYATTLIAARTEWGGIACVYMDQCKCDLFHRAKQCRSHPCTSQHQHQSNLV